MHFIVVFKFLLFCVSENEYILSPKNYKFIHVE